MISSELVLAIHEAVLSSEAGLKGKADTMVAVAAGQIDFKTLARHLQKLATEY